MRCAKKTELARKNFRRSASEITLLALLSPSALRSHRLLSLLSSLTATLRSTTQ